MKSRKSRNLVPVEVVENIRVAMLEACEDRRIAARIRHKLLKLARQLEGLAVRNRHSRLKLPKRIIRDVLRVMTFLVSFRDEIKEMAYAIMGRIK